MWFLETFICRKDNGVLMHVIVLHKKQLSETETDIDIYICGNIRDLVSFHPPPPRAHSPPSSSPFLLMSLLRP